MARNGRRAPRGDPNEEEYAGEAPLRPCGTSSSAREYVGPQGRGRCPLPGYPNEEGHAVSRKVFPESPFVRGALQPPARRPQGKPPSNTPHHWFDLQTAFEETDYSAEESAEDYERASKAEQWNGLTVEKYFEKMFGGAVPFEDIHQYFTSKLSPGKPAEEDAGPGRRVQVNVPNNEGGRSAGVQRVAGRRMPGAPPGAAANACSCLEYEREERTRRYAAGGRIPSREAQEDSCVLTWCPYVQRNNLDVEDGRLPYASAEPNACDSCLRQRAEDFYQPLSNILDTIRRRKSVSSNRCCAFEPCPPLDFMGNVSGGYVAPPSVAPSKRESRTRCGKCSKKMRDGRKKGSKHSVGKEIASVKCFGEQKSGRSCKRVSGTGGATSTIKFKFPPR